jgi:hypothetical protein
MAFASQFRGILFIVARVPRMPAFNQAFGVLLIAAGLSIPFLGEQRVGRMVEWWLR